MGWGATLGLPPMRLGLGTLGGEFPLALGGKATPSPLAAAPPWRSHLLGLRTPLGGLYKGGREGSTLQPLAPPSSPATPLSLAQKLGEALPESRYIHHHAVVLLDLHQPLLPPCWIKKGGDVAAPYVC